MPSATPPAAPAPIRSLLLLLIAIVTATPSLTRLENASRRSSAAVVDEFCRLLKSYRITTVSGDRYAGGFASEAFNRQGIRYQPATRTKSDAYVDLLPLLNSGGVVLPRHDRLVAQLVGLERRTARGTGRDIVDHPPGGHDDLANAVAGAALLARAPGYDHTMAWVDGTPLATDDDDEAQRAAWRWAMLQQHIARYG